jgi:hypothetical protein
MFRKHSTEIAELLPSGGHPKTKARMSAIGRWWMHLSAQAAIVALFRCSIEMWET